MRHYKAIRAWAVVFWLIIWQLGAMALNQSIVLVSPIQVLVRLAQLSVTADFWNAIAYSLCRIALGFIVGIIFGTWLAALSAHFRRIEELLAPAMLALNSCGIIHHFSANFVFVT